MKPIYDISKTYLENVAEGPFFTEEMMIWNPYTALPFATVLSVQRGIPMVLKRKKKKEYSTDKMCEGVFQKNQRCLVIEDVITSGQSILEITAALYRERGWNAVN